MKGDKQLVTVFEQLWVHAIGVVFFLPFQMHKKAHIWVLQSIRKSNQSNLSLNYFAMFAPPRLFSFSTFFLHGMINKSCVNWIFMIRNVNATAQPVALAVFVFDKNCRTENWNTLQSNGSMSIGKWWCFNFKLFTAPKSHTFDWNRWQQIFNQALWFDSAQKYSNQ